MMSADATENGGPTILFYSQTLFGAGHWMRSMAIVAALARRARVVVVSGGGLDRSLPIPDGVEVESLPALEFESVSRLVATYPDMDPEALRLKRVERLVRLLHRCRPSALIVEHYPFGRHYLTDELAAWFAASREMPRRPWIVGSVRDIPEVHRHGRATHEARTCELVNHYFDAILVHSDPRWIRLEDTFGAAGKLRVPVVHTGFVVTDREAPAGVAAREPRIVVSAGGGQGGQDLLLAAVEAHRLGDLHRDFSMRIFAGIGLPEPDWQRLCEAAAGVPRLEVLRWTADLPAELATAAVSVSRCGYNTAMDLLRTGVPALVVPYVGNDEEQARRAEVLERRGLIRVLAPDRCDPQSLADEIRRTASFRPRAAEFDFDGARCAAEWLVERLSQPTAAAGPPSRPETPPIPCRPRSLPGEFWGITTFFNPAGYATKLANFSRFSAGVRSQGLRLMVVELAFGDAPFVVDDSLADRVVRLRSSTILWHKERLINLGLRRLPDRCDKVAWIDGDLLFEEDRWVSMAAERLESHVVIQLFQTACLLPQGMTWAPPEDFGLGIDAGQALSGLAYRMAVSPPATRPPANAEFYVTGHTGFAWAARRDLLERHGLYDAMVLGSGDLVIGHVMFGGDDYWGRACVHRLILSREHFAHLAEWGVPFARDVGGSVGYTPGRVLHLWHGRAQDRKYVDRMSILREIRFDPRSDLEVDGDGCWTWRRDRPEVAERVGAYFRGRREDP